MTHTLSSFEIAAEAVTLPASNTEALRLKRNSVGAALVLALAVGGLLPSAVWSQATSPRLSAPAARPAQAPAAPPMGEGIIVSVNDSIISSFDLKQRLLLMIVTARVTPRQDELQAYQQQALNSLIDDHLKLQEMKRWEVVVSDDMVNEELNRRAARSRMTGEQLLTELGKVGVQPETIKMQIRAELGWNMLVAGRYRSSATVGKEQVEALMTKIVDDSQKPQYYVSMIYLDPAVVGSQDNTVRAGQTLYREITQRNAPFAAVASQRSMAPSAAVGGEVGWWVSGDIDPALENALQGMTVNQVSEPIVAKDGVYILQLHAKNEGGADMVMRLRQASIPLTAAASEAQVAEAQAQLSRFYSRAPSCDAVTSQGSTGTIQVVDLGDAALSELSPAYASALRPLKAGQATAPMRNAQNINILYVCDRRIAGPNAPGRGEVESLMMSQRLDMLGKRYLRDIKATATIEYNQ